VAVLYRCFIKRRPIQWHKWLGVALLLLGPGVAEFGNLWHAKQLVHVHSHRVDAEMGRGLHSSTFQLNASASCGIGGAFRGCLRGS